MSLIEGLPLAAVRTNGASAEAFLWQFGGPRPAAVGATFLVEQAVDRPALAAYEALRRRAFVEEQGLFDGTDRDDVDDDPRTVVLVARDPSGTVHGGVRLSPVPGDELGWWVGSRLVVAPGSPPRTGAALVRAACARAEAEGALRFDAVVQADKERFFAYLGWQSRGPVEHRGRPHVRMRWPIGLLAGQAATKQVIAEVLGTMRPGGDGFVGDDGAPIPASDLVVATDAILPAMVERDPWWAGWCSVLVNVNDLAAMGAAPVGLLDTVAAPTPSLARRVMSGLVEASERYGVPVLGGHTQVEAPPALTVTMVGRAARPVPGGGGRAGDTVSVVADLAGGWRPGYGGRQWDSTTARSADELRRMTATLSRVPVRAAKDVSMAGLVGTLGMLAEASGCGAELDVAAVPRPEGARLADWLTCFPGFALVVAGDRPVDPVAAAPATAAACGRLVGRPGVTLVWPDGERTRVLDGPVVGLGPASRVSGLPVAEGARLRPFRLGPARPPTGLGEAVAGRPPDPRPSGVPPAGEASSAGSGLPVSRPSVSPAGGGASAGEAGVLAPGSGPWAAAAGAPAAGGSPALGADPSASGPGSGAAAGVSGEGEGSPGTGWPPAGGSPAAGRPGVGLPASGSGSSGAAAGVSSAGVPLVGGSPALGADPSASGPGFGAAAVEGSSVAGGGASAAGWPGAGLPASASGPGFGAAAGVPASGEGSPGVGGPPAGGSPAAGAGVSASGPGSPGAAGSVPVAGGPLVSGSPAAGAGPSGAAGPVPVAGGSLGGPSGAGAGPSGSADTAARLSAVGDGPVAGAGTAERVPGSRRTGAAFRSAAEGAGLAGVQSARSQGQDPLRSFVGGPFPNVGPARQGARPAAPLPAPPDPVGPLANLPFTPPAPRRLALAPGADTPPADPAVAGPPSSDEGEEEQA